ncbi:Inner membrane transport protein YnfM [bacterium HR33]|nr:Inner membrane transport protein YnfM [bacterium HR33]
MVALRHGIRANASQFSLLVLLVVFLGAVVGVERSVLPLLAGEAFGIASATATLSFLIAFGFSKALANYAAGSLADRVGRRAIMRAGWLFGVAVPPLIMVAPSWGWVTAANLLLGINQGLVWSTTIIMKIDLAGPSRRGLATGVNEFAGYLAVAGSALAAGYLAEAHGIRFAPFALALLAAVAGLLLSLSVLRDTDRHVDLERALLQPNGEDLGEDLPVTRVGMRLPSNRGLWGANQAGFCNNLKEGVAWGLFPLYFAQHGLGLREIGWIAATYPALWGSVQLVTGALSDRVGRRSLITGGLVVQAMALLAFAAVEGFGFWMASAVLLGLGTAAVYPTLIAQVGDLVPPQERASAIGLYRLWRDFGYVAGALVAGVAADLLGYRTAIALVGALMAASALLARELLPAPQSSRAAGWAGELETGR